MSTENIVPSDMSVKQKDAVVQLYYILSLHIVQFYPKPLGKVLCAGWKVINKTERSCGDLAIQEGALRTIKLSPLAKCVCCVTRQVSKR